LSGSYAPFYAGKGLSDVQRNHIRTDCCPFHGNWFRRRNFLGRWIPVKKDEGFCTQCSMENKLKVEREVRREFAEKLTEKFAVKIAEQELRLREELIRKRFIEFNAKLKREANKIIFNHEAQLNKRNRSS
jgi:hypothetical protein